MKKRKNKIMIILYIIIVVIAGIAYRIHQVNKGISNDDRHKQVKMNEYFNLGDVDLNVHKIKFVDSDENSDNKQMKVYIDIKKMMDTKGKLGKSYFDDFDARTKLYIINKNGTVQDKVTNDYGYYEQDCPNIVQIMKKKKLPGKEPEQLVLRYSLSSEAIKGIKENKYDLELGLQKDQQGIKFNYINITAKDLGL